MENFVFYAQYLYQSFVQSPGPLFTQKDFPDLSGQTWVVTGGTGGIGLELAKLLVGQNATVWIVGRNQEKLDASLALLKEMKPLAKTNYLKIDYNDLESVKPGIQPLLQSTSTLNGVIHCAGVMNVPPGSKTKQGYEQTLGVNTLATQLVQEFLDPLILATPDSRIVWLSSVGYLFLAPRDGYELHAPNNLAPSSAYGMSKALAIIQSIQWTKNHLDSSTKSLSVHPGVIKTDLTRTTAPRLKAVADYLSYPVEYGTYAPMYAALSPDVENNEYVVPWGRPGQLRPDVRRTAHGSKGAEAMEWIQLQIRPYM